MSITRTGKTNVSVSNGKATPAQVIRLTRMGRELRLLDQILSTDVTEVTITDSGPAPAWTTLTGDHISFSLHHMPMPKSALDVAVWLGTNAHELGHVLYSPRRESPLMRKVIDAEQTLMRGVMQLHNIVEDQREERLLLTRFLPWTTYLTAALSHHIVADNESAWLLLAGRTWMPASVRAASRSMFVARRSEKIADQVAHLIADYQRLTDPGDTQSDDAWRVLTELHDLFADDLPNMPRTCTVMQDGEPDTELDPADCQFPEADDAQDDDDDADDAAQGEPCDDGDEGDADGEGADGEGEGEGQGDDGDGQGKSNEPADDDAKTGKGAGKGYNPDTFKQDELRRDLRDAAQDAIKNDPDAAKDLESVMDALDYGRAGEGTSAEDSVGRFDEVTDAARRLHHQVGDALLDLRDESEPGWIRHVESGRLNAARYTRMIADENAVFNPEALFDRYEAGHMDATNIELCLLLDVSGSMQGHTLKLAESAWAIRHALDDIEGTCTVLTWSDGPFEALARPGERPDNRMFVPKADDGTDPTGALKEAYSILMESSAKIRIMLVMTDGDWYTDAQPEKLIGAMRDAKITTVLAHLGHEARPNPHGCEVAVNISDLHGLARLFSTVAAERIKNQW